MDRNRVATISSTWRRCCFRASCLLVGDWCGAVCQSSWPPHGESPSKPVWDAEARQKQQPLWKLLEERGGDASGFDRHSDTPEQLLQKVETGVAAGYRRIKIKVNPGWDLNVRRNPRALGGYCPQCGCEFGLHT